jgi:hypothetical protein
MLASVRSCAPEIDVAMRCFVVDAEDVEHRGVEVAEVDRVFGDVVAEVVGTANSMAAH